MSDKRYWIYILSNYTGTTFYVGFTNNIKQRVIQHKTMVFKGFTSDYNVDRLIYFEEYENVLEAIKREKQLKRWHKDWKIELVRGFNPRFEDLYPKIVGAYE